MTARPRQAADRRLSKRAGPCAQWTIGLVVAAAVLASCKSNRSRAPADVVVVNGHAESFVAWAERGVRDRIVVHVDAHDDYRHIDPGAVERLREIVAADRLDLVTQRLDSGTDELMNEGNFLFAAHRAGLIREIYWVVAFGSRAAPQLQAADRRALLEMGFTREQVSTFRSDQGRLTGTLHGVPFVVCGMADLPKLEEPVLLDIDIDLFSVLARAHSTPIADSLSGFRRDLVATGLRFDIVTVARSVDDGYTLLGHAYIAAALRALLSSPRLELPAQQWEILRKRSAAEALHYTGRLAEAIEINRTIVAADPTDAAAHYDLALSYFHLADWDSAHRHAERAARIDPLYERALVSFGESLTSRRQPGALRFLDTAETLHPGSPRVARARGDYYYNQQLYRLALAEYSKLELGHDAALAMRIGDTYMNLDDYADALMYYENGMRLAERGEFPNDAQFSSSWLLLGRYFEHVAGDTERARRYYDRYLNGDPSGAPGKLADVKRVSKLYE